GVKEAKANFDVAVYPNPNKGKFNLQLHNLNVPTVEATVTDLLGRVVWQRALPVTASQVFEEVALPAVKGMYLLQLKAGAEVVTRKVVVE
ncbi:MAG: T9SS type A sorting domain-containing protein, partial [Hymenobacteraceae bacterium]|nr:T9SS type A sorting domain-containing protein [Hymenobacteraceae bacterium]MDX5397288.1 T9SS type A sorting domain-containing protein [Hymenobacteraceae bacterium]MDX5513366.1 T9SS type A sorting domain-containing protein [Hymenobacteraceae bacterium]